MKVQMQRRIELLKNKKFRELCAKTAKEIGITPEEWDNNKPQLLIHFANEACKMEDEDPSLVRKF